MASFPALLISLDLEFNQPSKRIIQVGATAGNLQSGLIESSFVAYVNPSEPIDPRISRLTGIEQHHVDAAQNVDFVYKQLSKWVSQFDGNRHINPLTWGGGDSDSLRQALGENEEWIFGRRWIDAKTLFTAWRHSQSILAQGGLAKSMSKVGLRFEGQKHNALADAVNTWRIYWSLLQLFDKKVSHI